MSISPDAYAKVGVVPGWNKYGKRTYKIPCCKCGTTLIRHSFSFKLSYKCDYCKLVEKEKWKAVENELNDILLDELNICTKQEKKFHEAVKKMFAKRNDIHKYGKAIKLAKTRCELYDSVPEIFMAIELLYLGHRIIPQQKVAKYKLDFVLPDKKIVIEVDGKIFHSNRDKEALKDFAVQNNLGQDWKVLHIPTDYIMKDMKKVSKYLREVIK